MESPLDPMAIVEDLAALPHRGAGTEQERRAADLLVNRLVQLGADVERQPFSTPKTFIWLVWWLIAGLVAGLMAMPVAPWPAFALVVLSAGSGLLYFDWRWSPVSLMPPRAHSENVIGRAPAPVEPGQDPGPRKKKLILMAHYDTAPVSLLYLPSQVAGLRRGLLITLGLMVLAMVVALATALGGASPLLGWLRWLLVIYFVAQGVVVSFDYLRYGFTNGAADNASGTAAAIGTFERLLKQPIPGWDVEVVLTGAEEVIMVGARVYKQAIEKTLDRENTHLLNFDNLGAGQIKIVTRTGSLTSVVYDNLLVQAALDTATQEPRFQGVEPGEWHTGDFDSLWFARDSVSSLTLAALDAQGRIPHLHRPSDTLENVDPEVVRQAVDFAEATVRRLAAGPADG